MLYHNTAASLEQALLQIFLNVFQDNIQPYGHEMLGRVRLSGINSHSDGSENIANLVIAW